MEDMDVSNAEVGQIWSDIKLEENKLNDESLPKSQNITMEIKTGSKENLLVEGTKKEENIKAKKYQCKICNNVLSKKGHLDRHMKIHSGERKFKCEFCGKGFIQPNEVRRHERVHIGSDYKFCDLCDKSYTSNYELSCHMKIHTGVGLFKCDICQDSFTQNRYLKSHKRYHEGDKILAEKHFACDICNVSFNKKVRCLKHKRITHNAINSFFVIETTKSKTLEGKEKNSNKGTRKSKSSRRKVKSEFNKTRKCKASKRKVTSEKKRLDNAVKEEIVDELDDDDDFAAPPDDELAPILNGDISATPNQNFALPNGDFATLNNHFTASTNDDFDDIQVDDFAVTPNNDFDANQINDDDDEINKAIEKSLKDFIERNITEIKSNEIVDNKIGLNYLEHQNIRELSNLSKSEPNEDFFMAKRFFCTVCRKTFLFKIDLEIHQTVVSTCRVNQEYTSANTNVDTEPFKEATSGDNDKTEINLDIDFKMKEEIENTHKCNICNELFSNGVSLKKHKIIHTGDMPFHCDICNKGFLSKYLLMKHKKAVNKCVGKNSLDDSFEASDGEDILVSDSSFNNDCVVYVKIEEQEKDKEMDTTNQISNKNQSFDFKLKCDEKDWQPIKCKLCSMQFKNNRQHKKHMVVAHTDEIPFRCDVCDRNFLFKSDYEEHIKRKKHLKGLRLQKRGKLNINRSRLQCEFCDLLFKNGRLLKGHLISHTGKVPFRCDVCNHDFLFKADYKRHEKSKVHWSNVNQRKRKITQ